MGFIEQVAPLVQKYAPQYGIKVCSPIIAQAVLESASGTSDKVKKGSEWRHNYFGLKWRDKRCAVSNDYFEEWTSEQRPDGSYYRKVDRFCKFKSLEDCVIGYFQWTNIPNYSNLKGVTDPKTYLENIKADKYATSKDYVKNLMAVISKYNLTKYDIKSDIKSESKGQKMLINIHAGHNPDGKVGCGTVGLIKESTEARKVKDECIKLLKSLGHTVFDCTVDNGTSQKDVLKKIVEKANKNKVDLDVSIHFNGNAKDTTGNGVTTGTEVYIYNTSSKAKPYAENVCKEISALGFKNRGVKTRSSLYVLSNSKSPAMLIECCFVDDKDDIKKYSYDSMARAIVKGITGQEIKNAVITIDDDSIKRVQTGAFSKKENAEALLKKVKKAGFDAFITKSDKDNLYRVQVGAYSKIENAEDMLSKIKAKGFSAFITN